MRCPGFERLLDYLDGTLAAEESTGVAAHLATDCARCAENQQWYIQVRAITASDNTIEPPAWVINRALRIFAAPRTRLVERFKEAVAALVFDSFARPAVAGVRATQAANRQLLYRAGDYSIDLQLAAVGQGRADLLGQVLREGETTFASVASLSLEVLLGDQILHEAITNDLGEFVIAGVEPGEYNLRISTHEGSITAYGVPVVRVD